MRKRVGSSASSQIFDDEPDDSDDDLESHLSPHEISQLTDSLNKVDSELKESIKFNLIIDIL